MDNSYVGTVQIHVDNTGIISTADSSLCAQIITQTPYHHKLTHRRKTSSRLRKHSTSLSELEHQSSTKKKCGHVKQQAKWHNRKTTNLINQAKDVINLTRSILSFGLKSRKFGGIERPTQSIAYKPQNYDNSSSEQQTANYTTQYQSMAHYQNSWNDVTIMSKVSVHTFKQTTDY